MKFNDLIILAVAIGGAAWLAKRYNFADKYAVKPLSSQARMLEAQESGMNNAGLWAPGAASVTSGGVWV